jgi:acyl carrier protein
MVLGVPYMSDRSESFKLLLESFCEALNITSDLVVDDLKYNSIAEWDSVAHMLLVSAIEEKFDVMFDTNEILDLSSVKQAKLILGKHGVEFS